MREIFLFELQLEEGEKIIKFQDSILLVRDWTTNQLLQSPHILCNGIIRKRNLSRKYVIALIMNPNMKNILIWIIDLNV